MRELAPAAYGRALPSRFVFRPLPNRLSTFRNCFPTLRKLSSDLPNVSRPPAQSGRNPKRNSRDPPQSGATLKQSRLLDLKQSAYERALFELVPLQDETGCGARKKDDCYPCLRTSNELDPSRPSARASVERHCGLAPEMCA